MIRFLDEDDVARRAAGAAGAWAAAGVDGPIAVSYGNTPEFVIARDAATALRLPFAPLNPKLAPPEIEHALAVSGARLLTVDAEGPAHPLRPGAAGATILFTSGTTGRPKACMRPESAEAARAAEITRTYGLSARDVHLVACPLSHSAPGIFLRACRLAGARTALLSRFDAATFPADVAAAGATVCFLVPTQVERLLAGPRTDLAPLRAIIVAGAPFAPASRARFSAWLGPGRLWEFYGASETGTIAVLPPDREPSEPGFVGWPPAGIDVRVVDGEIQVRSPANMSGYIGEAAAGEWIAPGDLGRATPDGGIILVDRKGDLIISGGANVYPAEVERALLEHPAVRGAVAFGRPHPDWGEEVCALVSSDAGAEELRAFLRTRIASYKIPKQIWMVGIDELPIGPSGKPLRRVARERYPRTAG